jgi:DNA invertase Pin-like site-specific DNA recombinase
MRLIGYTRVSRVAGREGESFIAVPVQRERIEKQAAAQGHVVVAWQGDLDQTGARIDRPAFEAALRAVESGEADGIAVARLDRFARSVAGAAKALDRLEAAGGVLISVDLGMDTSTSAGKLMRNVLMALAEFELDRIKENWQATTVNAIGRGVPVSRPPLGYLRREDGRFEPDLVAAPAVRELFVRRAAGASWTTLARFLDEKLPREDGKRWTRQTISGFVGRRTYLGEARQGEVVNVDAHPPLVTKREWDLAQATPSTGSRGRDGGALLAGIIRCGSCGHTLTRASDGARGYSNYVCRKRHSDGLCASPAKLSVDRADRFIEQLFLEQLDQEPLGAVGEPAGGTLDAALTALNAAELELNEYRDANLISVVGKDAYIAGLASRQAALDAARQAVTDANVTAGPAPGIADLGAVWPELTVAERRHLLASVIDRVVVAKAETRKRTPVGERVSVVWH